MVVKTHTMMGAKRVCPQAVRGHLAKEELESEFSVTVLSCIGSGKDGVMIDDRNISVNLTSETDLSVLEE